MIKDDVYRQQRRDDGIAAPPIDPKHEAIPKGDKCKVCQGSAMWMPSLSNVRFCVKCYPVHIEFNMGRTCDTNDDLATIDMGSDAQLAPPIVTPITKDQPVDRNKVLSGILGAKFTKYEGDDA